MTHQFQGHCPVCEQTAQFTSPDSWYRDNLNCSVCESIPRERAFAHILDTQVPDWRGMIIHESSPADRKASTRIREGAPGYIPSQFWPDIPLGTVRDGVRCENLEKLTFEDNSIEIHCHLDVLEHVNSPEDCFAEMERTLRPGGIMLFTTPVYEEKMITERRGWYDENGKINFIGEPEYHGNPISEEGAPVTFHYGQDFADLIVIWTKACSVMSITLNDPHMGILGKFREVFLVRKRE